MPTEAIRHYGPPPGGFLPYELSYVPDELQKIAEIELFEVEDTRVRCLKELRAMLKEEPNLHWQDEDLFLLAFLRTRKFDVKRTFKLVKTFYNVSRKRSELYGNFDFELVSKTLAENNLGFLPYRDGEGCAILLIRATRWNPPDCTLGDVMRALTCGLLHANLSPATHIAGFKVIFDFGGFTLNHLPHVNPTYLWLFGEALQNCFPGRFKAVHMVNEGHLWTYVWAVLRQFLSKKLKNRFYFHGKNVKKLHKYFSPSILPAEYEGELPYYDNTEWGKRLKEKSDYFNYVFSHGYRSPEN